MKKIYLSMAALLSSVVLFSQASDLFISEYLEGGSFNKALEIYNGTGSSVDLSAYSLEEDDNGGGSFGSTFSLTGTLADGEVYVVAHSSSAQAILDVADITVSAGVTNFNGDDQVRLLKNSLEIDRIGISGDVSFGQDVTFVRKSSVSGPITGEQDPRSNGEWDSYSKDTFDFLGSHSFDGGTVSGEPTNHITSFTGSASGPAQIDISWVDNDGAQAANGFLILVNTGAITVPIDGTDPVIDVDLSDNSGAIKVGSGVEIYSLEGLTPSTTYNFEIYPYSNSGINIDFKTDGTIPSLSVATSVPSFSSGDIVISEIMYNSLDTDEDWIEIVNLSGSSITLNSDWELSNTSASWSYTFASSLTIGDGEYKTLGISSTIASFTPDLDISSGAGALQNTSSTISLKAEGVTIDEVTYNEDFVEFADNDGPSLSLGDPSLDNTDATNWIGSAAIGGTPGLPNDVTVWTATSSTEWLNAGNWSNGVPSATLSAIVVSGGSSPMIADDVELASFKVNSGVDLIISAGTTIINDEFILDGVGEVFSGASLAILGDETGSGDITIFRNTNGNVGYSIIGSPVSDAELIDLSADFLYGYSEADSSFPVPTGSMVRGVGYFVGYNGSSPSVSLTGNPNSGTVTSTITLDGAGFNLVANPYAAAISMSSLRTGNPTDIDGVFYLWDDGGTNVGADRAGDYITASSVEVVGGSVGLEGTSAASLGNIASVQGFFVHANNAGSVSFTPDMQVTTTGANVDANHYRESSSEKQSIRLSISGNGLYNEILVGLRDDATLGMDIGLDALKFSGNELIAFYSMIGDQKFAIQTLPKLSSESIEVQLGIDLAEAGSYKLNINEMIGFDENTSVILIDNHTGKFYDLNEVSEIDFINNESVFTSKRFELVLAPAAVLSSEIVLDDSEMVVFTNDLGLNIITSEAFSNAEVKVYSLSGSVVSSYSNVDFSNKAWATSFDKKGLFILKIESENGLMIKKFLN